MRKAAILLIGIFLSLFIIGCSPQEAIHTNLVDDEQLRVRGRTGDNTYQVPLIDVATGAFQVIETDHHEVHGGDSYHVSNLTDLGNGANATFLFITPDTTKWIHLIWIVEHELETRLEFFEDTAVSSNGATLIAYNRNRNSNNSAGVLVFKDPTVTSQGTILDDHQSGSGKKAGGGQRGALEWILKQNANYILRITNQTVNNNTVASQFIWYEHTDRSP